MPDLNARQYWANRPNANDPEELARQMYANDIALGPQYGGQTPEAVKGFMKSNNVFAPAMADYYRTGEQMVDPGSGFWKGLVEKSMKVFDTLAMPQQMIYQLATNGDWRKAIPDFFAPDEWAAEGLHHEIITFSDVLNVWSDDALDEWYQSNNVLAMAGEVALKTASFVGDVFTDPLTYVPMGLGVKIARKALPLGVQAEFLGRMAVKTGKAAHADDAVTAAENWVQQLSTKYAADQSPETLAKLTTATKNMIEMDANRIAVYDKLAKHGDDMIVEKAAKEGIGPVVRGSVFRDAQLRAHEGAFKIDRATVLRHMPDFTEAEATHAAVAGVDDAVQISDGLAQVVLGAGADDVLVRFPKHRAYYNSMNTPAPGVMAGNNDEIVGKYTRALDELDASDAAANTEMGALIDEVADTDLAKKFSEGTIERADLDALGQPPKELDRMFKKYKKRQKAGNKRAKWRKQIEKDGAVPEDLIKAAQKNDWADIVPNSARRSPLQADDYLDSQWGKYASRVAGVALYPKSMMPKPAGWFSHLVREPSRVLADHAPEMRQRLMDSTREYQFFMNAVRKDTQGILERGGILETQNLTARAKNVFLHGQNATVNKERSSQLTALLDAKYLPPGASEEAVAEAEARFAKLWDKADDSMREAYDEMRSQFKAFAKKLNLDESDEIEDYVPHIRKLGDQIFSQNMFKNGALPPDMEGLSTKAKVFFGSLNERKGANIAMLDDITQIMDVYTRGVGRKAYLEPMTQDLTTMARELAIIDPKNRWLTRFTDDLVADIKGTPSALSHVAERIMGTKYTHLARGSAGMVATLGYSAALTGNLRYPVMSILQALNTTSAKYGPLRTMRGLGKMMMQSGRAEAHAAGVAPDITQIYAGLKSWAAKARGVGVPSIEETEFFIRGLTYHASLGDELARLGYNQLEDVADDAIRNRIMASAIRETEEANHVFGVIGRPVGFARASRTGSMVATQFLSFPFKQTETLLGIGLENPGAFIDYLHIAGKIQHRAAQDLGIDVSDYTGVGYATDIPEILEGKRATIPLQALMNMSKFTSTLPKFLDGADPEEMQTAWKALGDSLEMMVPYKTGMEQLNQGVKDIRGLTSSGSSEVRKVRNNNLTSITKAMTQGGTYDDYRFGELQYTKGQEDFASIFTGMRTIKGKIEKDLQEKKYRTNLQTTALQAQLTEELWDAVRTGNDNPANIEPIIQKLRGLGTPYKDLKSIKSRAAKIAYAANMTVKAREQLDTTEQSYPDFLRESVEGK